MLSGPQRFDWRSVAGFHVEEIYDSKRIQIFGDDCRDSALVGNFAFAGADRSEERRVAYLRRGPWKYEILAAGSDQRVKFQHAETCLALPYRESGTEAGIQHGGYAADDQRRCLHNCRGTARRRGA